MIAVDTKKEWEKHSHFDRSCQANVLKWTMPGYAYGESLKSLPGIPLAPGTW